MLTLYVTTPGAHIRRRGAALRVEPPRASRARDGAAEPACPPREFELHRLELVALVGRAHLTTEALHACLEGGVGVAYFSRGGRFRARLVPEAPRAGDLRTRQYAAIVDPSARLGRARGLIAAKAENALAVLRAYRSNAVENPALSAAIARLRLGVKEIESSPSLEALLGWEGTLARIYFQALATLFRGPISLPGRRRRPPPDPANALLSFGYVLLGDRLAGRLEARGLDPGLGFFHEPRPGRPSLALDLLEEFRHPVVDRCVARLCNLRILRPEHFEADPERPGGVRLTREGLGRFFEEWEAALSRPLREAPDEHGQADELPVLAMLDRQIERLVADLRGGPPYRSFRARG